MFTVLSNTRNTHMYLILAVAIAAVILLTISVAPSIDTPRPAHIPVTAGEDAYVEYLRGEKTIYANPSALSDALSAYHRGEKAPFEAALQSDVALTQFLAGEKVLFENPMDLGAALMAYHRGEKFVAPSLESAMWEYRQGEWGLK